MQQSCMLGTFGGRKGISVIGENVMVQDTSELFNSPSPEILDMVDVPGVPGRFDLELNAVVMIMRNINIDIGMVNGQK